jgi:phosphohistidine swiveling domain-containing protein
MQDVFRNRFTKLQGLFRIEDLRLPHPDWHFVVVDPTTVSSVDPEFRSKLRYYSDLRLSENDKWTVRTCLVEGRPTEEYGLKRAVGVASIEVKSLLTDFQKYYRDASFHPIFVVYPYFSADKSGIVEIHQNEELIEAVNGSQWRLTEEGAPSESWHYRGERNDIDASRFERRLDYGTPILTPVELNVLVSSISRVPDNDVLLEWTFTPEGNLLFYDMRSIAARETSIRAMATGPSDFIGNGASPGTVTGIVRHLGDASKTPEVKPGEILVIRTMTKALSTVILKLPPETGIISETGGVTSHPAIVSREFGIPMIVGLKGASEFLQEGQLITMDGSTGRVVINGRRS